MQIARQLQALRSPTRAGSSRLPTRSAQTDRYLALHTFFIRHASQTSHPRPFVVRSRPFGELQCRFESTPSKPTCSKCENVGANAKVNETGAKTPDHAQDYTPFIRRLIRNSTGLAANSPHRPTKDELLAAAGSWWERLRIRLKWFTIRGWRRFNTDDFSAFASWFVVGNTIWILIGTTTFVSAVLFTLNSLSLQEYVARGISDYLTSETGVTIIFESAIVPKWGASSITFRNVYISRRPKDDNTSDTSPPRRKTATATPPAPTPSLASSLSPDTYLNVPPAAETDNYTMFDINMDEVEVTLSFMRWLDGKGLLKDAKLKGVRGVVDRRSVWWDTSKSLTPADFRRPTQKGDFELESFHVEDALMTVYQPGGQRPYNVSIFNAAVGPLRKRWLFFDLMSAEAITGQIDNCLFSLHMPQKFGKAQHDDEMVKRMARFRIDGLPIEHAQYATGHTPPMSWITSGKLDAVLDIKFPHHPDDEVDIKAILDEIGRNVVNITTQGTISDSSAEEMAAATQASSPRGVIPGSPRLARPPLRAPSVPAADLSEEEKELRREVIVDIDLRFRDLKAAVPVFTSDLSVTNNALIRPIVAFINSNRTLVPIHCQVVADLSDFDGSWTLFETGLMTSISDQIYAALAHHVSSETANSKRIRQVSVWGIQRGAEVLLDAVRNVVDPAHNQLLAPI
ncbi:mitochondrion organization and biogenesis-related protein [Naematelia encephala]|uniref:Mitochondrion organization and biogenesis-related protein n=1 Tax=Naematelia encephala TaxID=71784 RepID=A0A1Y2BID3_9TREE|nr:mitochondrion organization and biogenesis-related protein [Naematelia encephala]